MGAFGGPPPWTSSSKLLQRPCSVKFESLLRKAVTGSSSLRRGQLDTVEKEEEGEEEEEEEEGEVGHYSGGRKKETLPSTVHRSRGGILPTPGGSLGPAAPLLVRRDVS